MSKKRGIAAERELLHLLWKKGWAVARVAGSGSMPEPSCDLLAGNSIENRRFAIECKTSRSKRKYLSKAQMEDFVGFAERFGLEPLLAVRFVREGWFFLYPEHFDDTGKHFAISLDVAREKSINLLR